MQSLGFELTPELWVTRCSVLLCIPGQRSIGEGLHQDLLQALPAVPGSPDAQRRCKLVGMCS